MGDGIDWVSDVALILVAAVDAAGCVGIGNNCIAAVAVVGWPDAIESCWLVEAVQLVSKMRTASTQ